MGELQAFRKADFNWVVHPDLVWDDELPHAHGLHGDVCDEIIEAARELDGPRSALGRLLLGPAGMGKTHLLAMLRRRAAREGITFVMADLTDVRDFYETLLLGFVVSLQQPDASGVSQLRAVLTSLIGYLSSTVDPEDYVRRLAGQKPEKFTEPITDILRHLSRKDTTHTARHSDVLRAAILLNARDYQVNSIGCSWLQGMEIDEEERRRYGFAAVRQKPSDIVHGLSWLASLRGPVLIAIDQLDPIVAYNRQAAHAERHQEPDDSVALAESILNDLCNGLGGLYTATVRALPVVTCLEGSLKTLQEYGLQSNLDRFEPPQSLVPLNDAATAEALVRGRLDRAYGAASFSPPHPTWPFSPEFFDGALGRAPRELLKRCDAHRRRCLRQGEVTELHTFEEQGATAPEMASPSSAGDPLDARFEALRNQADVKRLLDEQREDDLLSDLIVTAAACLVKESPADDAYDVVVDSEFPGSRHSFMALHARIRRIELATGAESHYCLRALERTHAIAYQARLRAAMTSAGIDRRLAFRHLAIFRVNPVPTGHVTATLTKDFHDKGGVMVAPSHDEIATLWALQQMAAEGHDTFEHWLATRQPVHKLPMMQQARLAKPPQTADSSVMTGAAVPGEPAAEGDRSKPDVAPDTPPLPPEPMAYPTPVPVHPTPEPAGSSVADGPPEPASASEESPVAAQIETGDAVSGAALPVGRRILGGEPRGDTVTLPLAELRKHVAIFAGAGSGKTVLVKRLVEEAALHGIPAIIIDTANDLAQLGDPWPSPPENWNGEDGAKAARYFDAVETVVWTPGLESGNPVHLSPLPDLAAVAGDADELNEAIDMARDALQSVVARTRSEASHKRLGILTAALRFFAEQGGGDLDDFVALLSDLPPEAGGDITDAPKQASKMADAIRSEMQIDPLLAGSGVPIDPAVLLGLDRPNGRTRVSIINLSGLTTLDQQQQFLNRLAMTLFSWIKSHPAGSGAPLRGLLVVDEARDFIPAVAKSACRDSFVRLAAQARKYGLGLILATQAPKEIHNGIVSNCSTSFYGKGNSPAVINAIKELLVNKGGRGDDVARLRQGQFYFHNADVTPAAVKIGTRLCLSHHRDPLPPESIAERASASRTS